MNKELLKNVLTKIKDDPKSWTQWMWAIQRPCGTSHCFAGHVVHIALPEAKPHFECRSDLSTRFTLNSGLCSYKDTARALLGLTERECDKLFDANNTLEDLERVVKELTGETGT